MVWCPELAVVRPTVELAVLAGDLKRNFLLATDVCKIICDDRLFQPDYFGLSALMQLSVLVQLTLRFTTSGSRAELEAFRAGRSDPVAL